VRVLQHEVGVVWYAANDRVHVRNEVLAGYFKTHLTRENFGSFPHQAFEAGSFRNANATLLRERRLRLLEAHVGIVLVWISEKVLSMT
jgi:hypothetical protein